MAMTSILLPRSGDLSHPPACSVGRPWWEELGKASLRQRSPQGAHPAGHGAGQRGSRPILRPDCSPGGAWIRGSSLHAAFPTH